MTYNVFGGTLNLTQPMKKDGVGNTRENWMETSTSSLWLWFTGNDKALVKSVVTECNNYTELTYTDPVLVQLHLRSSCSNIWQLTDVVIVILLALVVTVV